MKANEASTKVFSKYTNFKDILLPKLTMDLPDHTSINNYAIKLVNDWQPPYGYIYNLGLVKLKILKTYIENNLANSFIRPSKSFARASIFFNQKLDRSLRLYINYWDLNNLIIKNQYSLFLVGKLLDRLGWTRCFTQLNLTNTYYWMRIWKENK